MFTYFRQKSNRKVANLVEMEAVVLLKGFPSLELGDLKAIDPRLF